MKIALIGKFGNGDILAGPERMARELFYELKNKKVQVVFIEYFFSGYENSNLYKKLFGKERFNSIFVVRLGIFPLIFYLLREKFEIIHIVNLQRFVLPVFFVKPFINSKLTATIHGFLRLELPQKNFWIKRYFIDLWIEKLIVNKCQLLVFPSQLLFDKFNKHYNILERKHVIIPNGISEVFKSQDRNFPPIENSLKIIFYSGTIEASKERLKILITSLEKVNYKIELYVIGEKGKAISSNRLNIVYTEQMSHQELVKFLNDKHFIIKSGAFDSFSILVAECMLASVIPVVNHNVGISELIQHEVNGFLYDNSISDDLSELLNKISERKYDLELISNNAKNIYSKLNWNSVTKNYIKSFESISN